MPSETQELRRVSNTVKRLVAYRYRYKCAEASCRVTLPPTWECDHIIPLWKISADPSVWTLDPNHLTNLQPLCPSCHRTKTLRETLERETRRLSEQYSDELAVHTELNLDDMLQIQEVCKSKTQHPPYYPCTVCGVKYSPHFKHSCKLAMFHTRFAFDPDAAPM